MRKLPLLLVTFVVLYGCSSLPSVVVPELSRRTLRIAKDFAGFTYTYCAKNNVWGKCKQMVEEKFDLADPIVREKLRNMGFVALVEKKPI